MTKRSDDHDMLTPAPTGDMPDTGLFANTPAPKSRRTRPASTNGDPILFAEARPAKRTPATPRKPQPRWRDEDMPLRPGDVIAVGLDNGRCPVGRITGVNDFYIRLALYSWITRRFTAGEAVLRHGQVREFSPLAVQDDDDVYDMEPLRQFQVAWEKGEQ
ncbi:hypothetical protein ABT336_12135 [Micromonospora sp. NPDC000207]|uniref:hypothetical protein n=1 Tax=Micromonospora sp. NPDC000207 TaxID=3154246 RepID=UPI00331707E2